MIDHETPRRIRLARSIAAAWAGFGSALVLMVCFVRIGATQSERELRLSLSDAITLAVEQNLTLRQARLDPDIRQALIDARNDRFKPVISVGSGFDGSQQPAANPFIAGADVQTSTGRDLSVQYGDPLKSGGGYGVSLNGTRATSNSRNAAINPAYRASMTFDVIQPLLNGFRKSPELTAIAVAENDFEISQLQLKEELIRALSDVEVTYWELVFALKNLDVQQTAALQAKDLQRRIEGLRAQGMAIGSDVLQAKSVVATREAAVISAFDAIEDAHDRLKRLINLPFDGDDSVTIVPTDTPNTDAAEAAVAHEVDIALERRTDYQTAKIDLATRGEYVSEAENARQPQLDLEGSLSLNGLGAALGDPLSQVGKAEHRTWHVGVALRIPIEGQGANAELERVRLERERARLALDAIKQQIVEQVRGATRQVETTRHRIDATRAAEEFARQALSIEERRYELGYTLSHDLLEFQADLAEAATNHLRAVVDYRIARVELNRATGTTLETLGAPGE